MKKLYTIRFGTSAGRTLQKLDLSWQVRISRAINALAENPFPLGARKLKGEERSYRIRIGDHRVVYDVLQDVVVVLILRIGHRKDVYR
ncbi:MAG: type II toxin-antitoxin system RelE/ParE family toxin [Candidatus Korobacteraceae bacterium]